MKNHENHETTMKNHGNQPKTMKNPWNYLEKQWLYLKKPWKPTYNHEKPWNYLEKPWKQTLNHEKPWNYFVKPWKPTKNHETTLENHGNQHKKPWKPIKTIKTYETTLKNQGNQPKTMKLPCKIIKHYKQTDRHFEKVIIFRDTHTYTNTLHHNIYITIIKIKSKGNLLMVCCNSSFSSSILLFTSSKSLSRSPWELFNQYIFIYISINILSCCDNYLSLTVTLKTQIFQTENFCWRLSWNQTVTCSNRTFSLFTTSKRSFAFPSIWS